MTDIALRSLHAQSVRRNEIQLKHNISLLLCSLHRLSPDTLHCKYYYAIVIKVGSGVSLLAPARTVGIPARLLLTRDGP